MRQQKKRLELMTRDRAKNPRVLISKLFAFRKESVKLSFLFKFIHQSDAALG